MKSMTKIDLKDLKEQTKHEALMEVLVEQNFHLVEKYLKESDKNILPIELNFLEKDELSYYLEKIKNKEKGIASALAIHLLLKKD